MIQLGSKYHTRPGDALFVSVLTARNGKGVRAGIITGAPGVGKTFLGQCLAEALQGECVYYLAHHWTSDEDLFLKLDPARVAAMAGGRDVATEDAYRPGALLRAIESSQNGPSVLILDEWDKAPQRADALLLDFLQSGQVQSPFGETFQAVNENLFVLITDNGMRELAEPLQRRAFRYEMPFLPEGAESDILRKATGAGTGLCRMVVGMLTTIRKNGDSSPSVQEGIRLVECLPLCQSGEQAELLVKGFLLKSEKDEQALKQFIARPGATLLGEYRKAGK